MGFWLRLGQDTGFTSTKSIVFVRVPWWDDIAVLLDAQQGSTAGRHRVWQDPLLGLLLLQKMWLPTRFVKNRLLKKFGTGSSVSIHHVPMGWLWLCKTCFMQQMVCYFRICILISGPFSSVALGDIFTYSSQQSELAASDTRLTL